MIVYIDQIFVINFFADFILLHISSGLGAGRRFRFTLAAALTGALYATVIYIPGFEFMGKFFIKIIVFVAMVLICFRPKGGYVFFKNMAVFGAVSAFFGGSVFAVLLLSGYTIKELKNNSIVVFDVSTTALLLCFSIIALLGFGVLQIVYKSVGLKPKTVLLEMRHNGRRIFVNGLVDTGCTLNEPSRNRPVVIVDSRYADVFLREIGNVLMIPYSTVDNNGVFLGFYPDYLKVGKKVVKDVAVAVCYSGAMKDKHYSAIINSDVLKEENCIA